jgi:hypothetical protein
VSTGTGCSGTSGGFNPAIGEVGRSSSATRTTRTRGGADPGQRSARRDRLCGVGQILDERVPARRRDRRAVLGEPPTEACHGIAVQPDGPVRLLLGTRVPRLRRSKVLERHIQLDVHERILQRRPASELCALGGVVLAACRFRWQDAWPPVWAAPAPGRPTSSGCPGRLLCAWRVPAGRQRASCGRLSGESWHPQAAWRRERHCRGGTGRGEVAGGGLIRLGGRARW